MNHLRSLLVCLALILSLGIGSLAHAGEGLGCIDAVSSGLSAHVDGDRDQVPADADKPYPHHHGECQNHQFGVAVEADGRHTAVNSRQAFNGARDKRLTPAASDPALRPPQA